METDGGKVGVSLLIQRLLESFLSTWEVCLPLNIPSFLAAAQFRPSFKCSYTGEVGRENLLGHDKQAHVLRDSAPLTYPPHLVLIFPVNTSLSCIGFDVFTSYPLDPRIPSSDPYRHTCFSCCRTLISRIGINERGKKGIFPSNYVR